MTNYYSEYPTAKFRYHYSEMYSQWVKTYNPTSHEMGGYDPDYWEFVKWDDLPETIKRAIIAVRHFEAERNAK